MMPLFHGGSNSYPGPSRGLWHNQQKSVTATPMWGSLLHCSQSKDWVRSKDRTCTFLGPAGFCSTWGGYPISGYLRSWENMLLHGKNLWKSPKPKYTSQSIGTEQLASRWRRRAFWPLILLPIACEFTVQALIVLCLLFLSPEYPPEMVVVNVKTWSHSHYSGQQPFRGPLICLSFPLQSISLL
jgi:hypothetical protein